MEAGPPLSTVLVSRDAAIRDAALRCPRDATIRRPLVSLDLLIENMLDYSFRVLLRSDSSSFAHKLPY